MEAAATGDVAKVKRLARKRVDKQAALSYAA